jgi:C-terminal processing protease CtpA/Prc
MRRTEKKLKKKSKNLRKRSQTAGPRMLTTANQSQPPSRSPKLYPSQRIFFFIRQSPVAEKVFQAFAKVTEVTPMSPADVAGLKVGDEIIEYGDVNYLNHDELRELGRHTVSRVGKQIRVYFRRMGCIEIEFSVYPKVWDGPGVLGCRFNLLDSE